MQALYYDREPRPVSWQRWRQPGRQPGSSRAGRAGPVRHGRQAAVITFWPGITAGCRPAGPLIFCTCAGICDPASPRPACQRQRRWPALAAARAGHHAVTAGIAETAAFPAGHASRLPAPDPDQPATPPSGAGQGR
jgi:hypothetical protein